jgi:hypothetical protein
MFGDYDVICSEKMLIIIMIVSIIAGTLIGAITSLIYKNK